MRTTFRRRRRALGPRSNSRSRSRRLHARSLRLRSALCHSPLWTAVYFSAEVYPYSYSMCITGNGVPTTVEIRTRRRTECNLGEDIQYILSSATRLGRLEYRFAGLRGPSVSPTKTTFPRVGRVCEYLVQRRVHWPRCLLVYFWTWVRALVETLPTPSAGHEFPHERRCLTQRLCGRCGARAVEVWPQSPIWSQIWTRPCTGHDADCTSISAKVSGAVDGRRAYGTRCMWRGQCGVDVLLRPLCSAEIRTSMLEKLDGSGQTWSRARAGQPIRAERTTAQRSRLRS